MSDDRVVNFKGSPEYYFTEGASAMQAQIAAWLVVKGHLDLAPFVLELPPPRFRLSEES